VYREMTVALIRDHKDAGAVEVAFSESARFCKAFAPKSQIRKYSAAIARSQGQEVRRARAR
jgi:hypothetical protein